MKTCNVLAINGSPRKNGNSIALLHSAMEGARVAGGAVTLLHLADYRYQGHQLFSLSAQVGTMPGLRV